MREIESSTAKTSRNLKGGVSPRLRELWPLLPALAFGIGLRIFQLGAQVPVGDEWHNLDAIWRIPLPEALAGFDPRFSLPMVLYGKFLLHTIGLSGWGLYLPGVVAGSLLILFFPLLVSRVLGRSAAVILGWLLALSPMLVLYSRFYRPYIFTCLLGLSSLYFGWRWWEEKRLRFGLLYALSALLSMALHIITGPFVLSPILILLICRRQITDLPPPLPFRQLLKISALLLPLIILIVIPIIRAPDVLGKKLSRQSINMSTLRYSTELFSGIPFFLPALLLIVLAGWGLFRLFRRHRGPLSFAAAACLLECLAILLVAPTSVASALVFSRYMIQALPVFLLCLAAGIAPPGNINRGLRGLTLSASGLLLPGLLLFGPLPRAFFHPNSFCSQTLFVEMLQGNRASRIRQCTANFRNDPEALSPFYKALSTLPPSSCRIAETPFFFRLTLNKEPWLQEVHHQDVVIGLSSCFSSSPPAKGGFPCGLAGLDFRSMVFLGGHREKPDVDFIVVHLDLVNEFAAKEVRRSGLLRKLRQQLPPVPRMLEELEESCGKPCYRDSRIVVFPASVRGRQLAGSLSFSPSSI